MTADQKLAHALMIKFGTGQGEPNDVQLSLIKTYIQKVRGSGRIPTNNDWSAAVHMYCPSAGRYKYAGIDNSDLNTLLALAIQMAKKGSQ